MTDNILIFRTSIEKRREIKKIEKLFTQYPQIHVWNVDFEDWEKYAIYDISFDEAAKNRLR